jgi:hypothetical protein
MMLSNIIEDAIPAKYVLPLISDIQSREFDQANTIEWEGRSYNVIEPTSEENAT